MSTQPLQQETHKFQQETHKFQQETRASIQNLESQMSQLASSVSRLESQGKLSSQIVVNSKQNIGVIALCSEKELQAIKDKNSTKHGHAKYGKIENKFGMSQKQVKKPDLTKEEHPKVFLPKPLFLERFAKSKNVEDEKEILETLGKVEVNIPLLDEIKQIPCYASFSRS
ncbi:UNVERIFIED_CONTAM: hypothetical protein Slati_1746400 [Sesamum latifolium]|uniref:Uncharacterized protein n=1 Tax=Sesamum latifolium TaxID=2727402 RepID=A0AAW2WWX0_9LAMI